MLEIVGDKIYKNGRCLVEYKNDRFVAHYWCDVDISTTDLIRIINFINEKSSAKISRLEELLAHHTQLNKDLNEILTYYKNMCK